MDEYRKIDSKTLFFYLLKKLWIIVLTAIAFALIAFCFTKFVVTPEYKATIRLYVNNRIESTSTLTSSDVSASKSLVDTYITIIESNSVIDDIAEKTQNKYSSAKILNMLSAKSINGTEVFEVAITGPIPADCAAIANMIADYAPDKISEIVDGSSVKVIDRAKIPTSPISPNSEKNAAAAGLIGIIISCFVLLRMFISDATIYGEEDIKVFCTLPILGILPELSQANQGKYAYYAYSERSVES